MIHQQAVEYAGAIADGELELVPAGVREHLAGCPECEREVRWQREVNAGLARAFAAETAGELPGWPAAARPRRSRRLPSPALLAAIAAAFLLVATAGALTLGRGPARPAGVSADTVMTAAERGYGKTPALATSDPAIVAGWTESQGMGVMTPPSLAGATLMGARTWSVDGVHAVTFVYADQVGQTEVTAIAGTPPAGWPMSETRMMGGHAVGVVGRGSARMVVVAADEPDLVRTMAAVQ